MSDTQTIFVGADKSAEYIAFGDDSQLGDVVAFAVLIARRTRVARAEERLQNLKFLFKIPQEIPLHCRILFSGDARKKAGLNHLKQNDIQSIIRRAVRIINRTPMVLRYGRDIVSRFRESIGEEIEFTHHLDGSKLRVPVQPDPKALLGMMMQTCFMVPPDGSAGPTASQCEIIVAEDPTKVRYIGPRRRRADGMYAGFSDIGAPAGSVFQLQPSPKKARDIPMLQLADIAAYICSHAYGDRDQANIFQQELGKIRYWWRAGF